MRGHMWKRAEAVLLALALCLGLTGCGGRVLEA